MKEKRPYYSIDKLSQSKEKIKKSEFVGRAFPIENADQAEKILSELRIAEKEASHHPFALISGLSSAEKRFSDDGEPQGTAGKPILDLIEQRELTQVLVVVSRYFGGIKLGAPGLLRAYRSSAKQALDKAGRALFIPAQVIHLSIPYDFLGKIDYYLREQGIVEGSRSFSDKVTLSLILAEPSQARIKEDIMEMTSGQLSWEKGQGTWVKKILDEAWEKQI